MKNSKLTFALMSGLPGAGKSTLAYELGHILGWYVIDKDEYMVKLIEQGWDYKSASEVAYKQSFDIARDMLNERHTSIILDSSAREPLTLINARQIVGDLGNIRLRVILCYANSDLRHKRVQDKPSFYNISLDSEPDTLVGYLQCFSHLPEDKLILNTNKPLEKCLEQAKNYLHMLRT